MEQDGGFDWSSLVVNGDGIDLLPAPGAAASLKINPDRLHDVLESMREPYDWIVVDLPTAFYITAVQIPEATIVGQFPTVGTPEHFGLVLAKGNSLTQCVDKALASLKSDGTLAKIQQEWLSNKASAPVLK